MKLKTRPIYECRCHERLKTKANVSALLENVARKDKILFPFFFFSHINSTEGKSVFVLHYAVRYLYHLCWFSAWYQLTSRPGYRWKGKQTRKQFHNILQSTRSLSLSPLSPYRIPDMFTHTNSLTNTRTYTLKTHTQTHSVEQGPWQSR